MAYGTTEVLRAMEAAVEHSSLYWLVGLSLVMVVVSLYYYLCVLKRVYFRDPEDTGVLEISGSTKKLYKQKNSAQQLLFSLASAQVNRKPTP